MPVRKTRPVGGQREVSKSRDEEGAWIRSRFGANFGRRGISRAGLNMA